MVAPVRSTVTPAEFEAFIQLPENSERRFEFIAGEIVEVPSNPYVSNIAGLILFFIRLFLRERGLKGSVTNGEGGFIINGERYAPDVAYVSFDRQPELVRSGYNSLPPDLAVEVVSDPRNTDELTKLRTKLGNYLAAGVVVWIVYPWAQQVEVYAPGQAVAVLDANGTLIGGDLLPGFALPLIEIFGVSQ